MGQTGQHNKSGNQGAGQGKPSSGKSGNQGSTTRGASSKSGNYGNKERRSKTENGEGGRREEGHEKYDSTGRPGSRGRVGGAGKSGGSGREERSDRAGREESTYRTGNTGRPGGEGKGRGEGPLSNERSGRTGRPGDAGKLYKAERKGRGEEPRRNERTGRAGRHASSGRPGKAEPYGWSNMKSKTAGAYKVEKTSKPSPKKETTRLNKYIAHAGICSRREADKLIEAGLISINGKIITELGSTVAPGDDVRYNGERLGNERKVYVLLNKPKDYVTTVDDPHAKKTVMELVQKSARERIYPVGRLDKNTTGVLLFTNDGELTRKLTHPSFNKKKIYHVFLNKNLLQSDLNKIAQAVVLEDGPVEVDAIAYSNPDSKREVGLEIHSGRNRVVRRLFESLDYKVTKLDRVYFAGLTKKNLPRGKWRYLSDKEIKMLKMNAFE